MHVLVYITASNIMEANGLIEALIKERLAACANVIEGVKTTYWWKGKIERDSESLIILKTREEKLDALIERVKQLHRYENPEIIAVPILKGSDDYLKWVDDALDPKH